MIATSWWSLTGSPAVDLIIRLSALVVALGVLWRYLVRPVLHYFRRLENTVGAVQTQLFTNGGSTLRDTVETMATNVTNIATVVGDLNDRVEFLERLKERQDLIDEITAKNAEKLKMQRPYLPPREAS